MTDHEWLSPKKLCNQPAEKPLKRFFDCSRLWVTGLKPGVNKVGRFQTFEEPLGPSSRECVRRPGCFEPQMLSISSHQITELLVAWSEGDRTALEELTPLVHAELRRLAHRYMGRERAGHTLQTTALVNEA